ncbi:MAG: hypothetical protein LBD15_02665 [Holosporales bacterium]|jgi:hypothetical protein|nr:hypothetical protein [Holosporales bacterium]
MYKYLLFVSMLIVVPFSNAMLEKDDFTCLQQLRTSHSESDLTEMRHQSPSGSSLKKRALVEYCCFEENCLGDAIVENIPRKWTKEETLIFLIKKQFPLEALAHKLEQNAIKCPCALCSVKSFNSFKPSIFTSACAIRTQPQQKYKIFSAVKEIFLYLDPASLPAYTDGIY